jgi:hypothetical protein
MKYLAVAALALSLFVPFASADSVYIPPPGPDMPVPPPGEYWLPGDGFLDFIIPYENQIFHFEEQFPASLEKYITELDFVFVPFTFDPVHDALGGAIIFTDIHIDLPTPVPVPEWTHVTPVPEPNTASLILLALLGFGMYYAGKRLRRIPA